MSVKVGDKVRITTEFVVSRIDSHGYAFSEDGCGFVITGKDTGSVVRKIEVLESPMRVGDRIVGRVSPHFNPKIIFIDDKGALIEYDDGSRRFVQDYELKLSFRKVTT